MEKNMKRNGVCVYLYIYKIEASYYTAEINTML